MTVFARADVLSTGLSRSHGGCGETHSRPVENGAPVKLWALECPQCEPQLLLSSALWAPTISEIPETHDEQLVREDQEKRGERDAAAGTAKALEKLAGLGELPAVLGQLAKLIMDNRDSAEDLTENCPDGHQVLRGARFCGECGAPMLMTAKPSVGLVAGSALPPGKSIDAARAAARADHGLEPLNFPETSEPVKVPGTVLDTAELEAKGLPELRELAHSLGVRAARSKADQIRLIADHYGSGGQ